jgi:uncharacterized membrane protein
MPIDLNLFSEPAQAAGAALATAVVTTAVVTVREWFKERGAEKRGTTQLNLAKDQLAVLTSWLSLNGQLSPGTDPGTFREAIQGDLDAAIEAVRRTYAHAGREGPRVRLGHVISLILLTKMPGGALFKFVRVLYWCSAVALLYMTPFVIGAALSGEGSALANVLGVVVAWGVIFLAPFLFLRWLTKYTSRRYQGQTPVTPPASVPTGG